MRDIITFVFFNVSNLLIMKNYRQTNLLTVVEKNSKKAVVAFLKLKNIKGGTKKCPPPFEADKKKN